MKDRLYMLDRNSIKVLFSEKSVRRRIKELAREICNYYSIRNESFWVLYVEKGAKIFAGMLKEEISKQDVHQHYKGMSSMTAKRTEGMGFAENVTLGEFDPQVLKGKNILLVEDIIDQGITLSAILKRLRTIADSCRVCVLINKPEHREKTVALDYVGFRVEKGWVVGVGMDIAEEGRDLPFIGIVQA